MHACCSKTGPSKKKKCYIVALDMDSVTTQGENQTAGDSGNMLDIEPSKARWTVTRGSCL